VTLVALQEANRQHSGDDLYLMVPPIFDPETEFESRRILEIGYGTAANIEKDRTKKEQPGKWTKPMERHSNQGVVVVVTVKITIKHVAWHRRGDYLATTSPEGNIVTFRFLIYHSVLPTNTISNRPKPRSHNPPNLSPSITIPIP
jgi:hypothetical protein